MIKTLLYAAKFSSQSLGTTPVSEKVRIGLKDLQIARIRVVAFHSTGSVDNARIFLGLTYARALLNIQDDDVAGRDVWVAQASIINKFTTDGDAYIWSPKVIQMPEPGYVVANDLQLIAAADTDRSNPFGVEIYFETEDVTEAEWASVVAFRPGGKIAK